MYSGCNVTSNYDVMLTRKHSRALNEKVHCVPLDVWGGGDYNIGANQAGKRARSLFNCISVADGIKINEQNKSIGIGPLPTRQI